MLCVVFARVEMICAHLDPPQNGAVHGTDLSHGSILTVACLAGFMFADGNLSKQLECLSVGSPQPVAVWDGQVDDCQRM